MSEYIDFPTDFITRTQENLSSYNGSKDVTNLINNCLGLIIIPKQKLADSLPDYTFDCTDKTYGITKSNIIKEVNGNYSLTNIIRHIRNGLSHGRINQETKNGLIIGLRIHDKHNDSSNENFAIELSVDEFKDLAINISNEFLSK